jgi:hypothetical protein
MRRRKKESWMRGSSPRKTFLFRIQNLTVVAGLDPATHEWPMLRSMRPYLRLVSDATLAMRAAQPPSTS